MLKRTFYDEIGPKAVLGALIAALVIVVTVACYSAPRQTGGRFRHLSVARASAGCLAHRPVFGGRLVALRLGCGGAAGAGAPAP